MDGRIEAGFRHRFRALLGLEGAGDLEARVEDVLREGRERAAREGLPLGRALAGIHEERLIEVRRRLAAVDDPKQTLPWRRFSKEEAPSFLCDPSLGGLARWLRAAGYEALVDEAVPGHRLPDEALGQGRVLLTTEAEVLLRRIVLDGSVTVVWVPSALRMAEQLRMVMLDLGLEPREARCMACGGILVPRSKEDVFSRIPPKTAKWLDEYYVCAGCDRLFWRGTHWERISKTLTWAAIP